ncbi:YbaB/EbfC family nucleoid-associated protein [Phycicoccus sonneratiae]|uniref:YbaB/EbfC DNA-binding family protein n=1 Tax=Phycicoccus sonneratiae TaxID=2807628 RepID=A0ABS2CGJ3_9MICO|nr:YbaB/EbfC family nucleoid-associated protein [Phycicoccus sonneraticus]MBM6398992.1 hypothetical protein [Phycicoccus sonneraticus]
MSEDIRDELHELRERNDREIQGLESVRPPAIEREGSDARGAVTVRIGPEGEVRDVRVAHDWRSGLTDDELAGAVVEALTRAQSEVAAEFLTGVEELEDQELPRARPMPMPQDSGEVFGRTEPVTPGEAERLIGELWAEVEQAMASMEASLDGFNARTGSARSAGGEVVVEIGAGGEVSRLELEPRWLARAHPANIGRLVTSTLHEAQSSVLRGFGDVAETVRAVQETMQRVGDPYTLSRRFGLTP